MSTFIINVDDDDDEIDVKLMVPPIYLHPAIQLIILNVLRDPDFNYVPLYLLLLQQPSLLLISLAHNTTDRM